MPIFIEFVQIVSSVTISVTLVVSHTEYILECIPYTSFVLAQLDGVSVYLYV